MNFGRAHYIVKRVLYCILKSLKLLLLLKLSNVIVPRLFEEKWRDTVFGFPWGVVRGAWFRVFSGYFVPLTPPTVSVRSF